MIDKAGERLEAAGPSPPARLAALAAVLAVSAAVRIWLILHAEVISRDGVIFIVMARGWSESGLGGLRGYTFHLGYPVLIVGMQRLLAGVGGGDGLAAWELSGQAVALLLGLAATAGVYLFAGRTFNWRVAWVAALLFGLGRKWAALGADVLSDAPAVCMQVWAVVLALAAHEGLARGRRRSVLLAAGAGLCAGGGYLIRPEALLAGALAAALLTGNALPRRRHRRLALACIAALIVSAAAVAAPYMALIGGLTTKEGLGDLLPAAAAPPGLCPLAAAGPVAATGGTLRLIAQLAEALHPVLAVLVCLWLAALIAARVGRLRPLWRALVLPRPAGAFLSVGAVVVLAPLLIAHHARHGFLSHRYVMFPAALAAPFAAAAVVSLARGGAALSRRPGRRGGPAWLLWLLVAAAAVPMLLHALRPLHEGKLPYRRVGEAVGRLVGPQDFLLADHPWVFHYSRVQDRARLLSRLDPQHVLWHVGKTQVRGRMYVAFSDGRAGAAGPGLTSLLAGRAFVPVAAFPIHLPDCKTDNVRVYRVDRPALP